MDLGLQQLEHARERTLTTGGQRERLQAPDADGVGAVRDRLEHVRAAHEAAVDDDLGASGDRVEDLAQDLDRRPRVVELAATVVGDVDRLDAMLDGQLGILGALDALEDERQAATLADAREPVPGQSAPARSGRAPLPWRWEGGDQPLRSPRRSRRPVGGRVDRPRERVNARRHDPIDELVAPLSVPADV